MKVYKITPKIAYSYGCALVAANNRKEAIKTYKNKNEFCDWNYDFLQCVCNIVDKLEYDSFEPTVIIDEIGAE